MSLSHPHLILSVMFLGHAYKVPVFCYANPIELMGENGGTSSNSGSSSSIVVAGGDSVITPVAMPLPSDYTIMDDNHETIVKGKQNV